MGGPGGGLVYARQPIWPPLPNNCSRRFASTGFGRTAGRSARTARVLAHHKGRRDRHHGHQWLRDRRHRRAGPQGTAAVLRPRPDAAARQHAGRRWSVGSPRCCGIRCGTPTFASTTACGPCPRRCRSPARTSRRAWPCWRRGTSPVTADLSSLLIGGARRQWRTGIGSRFDELVEHTQARWQRSGQIAHRAEPDLKGGRGGLRDVQLLNALAIAQLADVYPSRSLASPTGITGRCAPGAAERSHRTAPGFGPRARTAAGPARRRDRRGAAHRRPIRLGPHAQRRRPHDQLLRRRRAAHRGQRLAPPRVRRAAPSGAPSARRRCHRVRAAR